MPTSKSTIFSRVNRRRPCQICGKPDWCAYLRDDERISMCMRVSAGARKINHHGGAIFVHRERPIVIPAIEKIIQSPIAPIEIRDFVYTELIRLSPAARYRALIEGEKGLGLRGLKDIHFTHYGALPADWRSRDDLAAELLRKANEQFKITDALCGIRNGWIRKLRLGIVDYDNMIYLNPYNP